MLYVFSGLVGADLVGGSGVDVLAAELAVEHDTQTDWYLLIFRNIFV